MSRYESSVSPDMEGLDCFDLSLCQNFNYPDDFDHGKFARWLELAGWGGHQAPEDVLLRLGVAERLDGNLFFRNAGVLFFARHPRHFFPTAYITCLLFRGMDSGRILDRQDFAGGVVADIEDALHFIERNTRTAYRIEGLRRENVNEYPMGAVREAIVNAVMHRDWFFDGANVSVEIHAGRLEVASPGSLPGGMPPSALGRKSVRRNALIAELLHRIGFVGEAGTGIRCMRGELHALGCAEPVFEPGRFFSVIFRPNPYVRPE